MKVYIAADHAGYRLKEILVPYIQSLGHEVEDCGAYAYDETDDYPDIVASCAQKVATTNDAFGVVLGASGQGEAIAANRVPRIRAVVYYGAGGIQTDASGDTLSIIGSARSHNNANMLSLGARFIEEDEATAVVKEFLSTPFSNQKRHLRRVAKLG